MGENIFKGHPTIEIVSLDSMNRKRQMVVGFILKMIKYNKRLFNPWMKNMTRLVLCLVITLNQ